MTWTRLDDGWYEQTAFDDMPHDVRWHYLALIQTCSRNHRYDGRIPGGKAARVSDVEDPVTAHSILAAAGLIEVGTDGAVTIPRIDDHIPPPHYRDEDRKARQRQDTRRSRAHKAGNHTLRLPGRCKHAVSADVSAYAGTETGQDGSGLEVLREADNDETEQDTEEDPDLTPRPDALSLVSPDRYSGSDLDEFAAPYFAELEEEERQRREGWGEQDAG